MQKLAVTTLGGPFVDAIPVADPESEMAADEGNVLLETVAQGSYTSPATVGTFIATATAATVNVDATNVAHSSHWGSTSATKPTVTKTATGRYTLTFPVSWVNGLSVTESVSLFTGSVTARTGDPDDEPSAEVLTISANVVTIGVRSAGSLADVGGTSTNPITVDWCFFR
jgi:exosortase/archaeosortase